MQTIMQRINFTEEEKAFFTDLRARLNEAELAPLIERYMEVPESRDPTRAALDAIAARDGIHPYSLHAVFLLMCGERLPAKYARLGYDPELAYDLLYDIRCKLTECQKRYGVMGIFTYEWYHRHFLVTRFALGRFQYDPAVWEYDKPYVFGDYVLKKGDPIVRFHIPSSGKMTREMRMDSYKRVHAFNGCKKGEIFPIVCGSWLLWEGNREVYPEGSNLMDFMDDFDLIEHKAPPADDPFPNAWRVFYKDYTGDTSDLPRDTSLQRAYIDYLNRGGVVGSGTGVILFDGEKIINNKRDN